MGFLLKWALSYCGVMFAMSVDNIFWIPDGGEWSSIKKNFATITLFGRIYAFPKNINGWTYVWKKRVLEVLKHPRDIFPAVITSAILAKVLSW